MKRIVLNNNYVQLEEFNIYTNSYVLQLGFALSGLTYKIENRNVKFYLKEDYFYKNSVWSADIPLEINGTTYTEENIAEGLSTLFGQSGGGVAGVSSVNGKTGIVKLTANDVNAYTKAEVDDLIQGFEDQITGLNEDIDGIETEIDGIGEELDNYYDKTEVNTALAGKQDTLIAGQNISIQNNVISASGSAAQIQSDWNQSDSNSVDYIKNKPTIPDVSNYYTKSEVDEELNTKQDASTAFSGDYNDLTNKPVIPDVSNYYTKSESDNKFALKFTDVDDIQMVSALPANPDSRTLYLIPVQ